MQVGPGKLLILGIRTGNAYGKFFC